MLNWLITEVVLLKKKRPAIYFPEISCRSKARLRQRCRFWLWLVAWRKFYEEEAAIQCCVVCGFLPSCFIWVRPCLPHRLEQAWYFGKSSFMWDRNPVSPFFCERLVVYAYFVGCVGIRRLSSVTQCIRAFFVLCFLQLGAWSIMVWSSKSRAMLFIAMCGRGMSCAWSECVFLGKDLQARQPRAELSCLCRIASSVGDSKFPVAVVGSTSSLFECCSRRWDDDCALPTLFFTCCFDEVYSTGSPGHLWYDRHCDSGWLSDVTFAYCSPRGMAFWSCYSPRCVRGDVCTLRIYLLWLKISCLCGSPFSILFVIPVRRILRSKRTMWVLCWRNFDVRFLLYPFVTSCSALHLLCMSALDKRNWLADLCR